MIGWLDSGELRYELTESTTKPWKYQRRMTMRKTSFAIAICSVSTELAQTRLGLRHSLPAFEW